MMTEKELMKTSSKEECGEAKRQRKGCCALFCSFASEFTSVSIKCFLGFLCCDVGYTIYNNISSVLLNFSGFSLFYGLLRALFPFYSVLFYSILFIQRKNKCCHPFCSALVIIILFFYCSEQEQNYATVLFLQEQYQRD